jgi:hypothetical protein
MSPEKRTVWYKEYYIWSCIVSVVVGLGIVGTDLLARQAKQRLLAIKTEADQLYDGQKYVQAASRYSEILSMSVGYTDSDVQMAADESRSLLDQSTEKLAEARAKQAKREAEEADKRAELARVEKARQEEEQLAKARQDPEYLSILNSARMNEAKYPGVAARYYHDIVRQFPGTPMAREAGAKAEELWAIAYGSPDGSTSAEGLSGKRIVSSSGSGDLCGAPLGNGQTCRNRVKAGDTYCYLHSSRTTSSYGTHIGPRGGVYHYSKNGKKVYDKRR